jgi:hypothetical protein
METGIRFPAGVSYSSYSTLGTAIGGIETPNSTIPNRFFVSVIKPPSQFQTPITNGNVLRTNFTISQGSPLSASFQLYSCVLQDSGGNRVPGNFAISTQISQTKAVSTVSVSGVQ